MSKQTIYANRLLRIAAAKARREYPRGTKEQLLVYQLGFIAGMLGRHTVSDIAIKKEIRALEADLGIVHKD